VLSVERVSVALGRWNSRDEVNAGCERARLRASCGWVTSVRAISIG
jgi:hypothetical protein